MSAKTSSLVTALFACLLLFSYAPVIHAGDDTRFTLKDGVIDDSEYGLQWVPAPDLAMNHYQAEKYVRSLSLAGGGWRLPTRAELRSIYDPSKPGLVDAKFKVGGWLAWSSEVDSDPSFAWYFNFSSGGEYKYARDPACNEYFYVLAVRPRRWSGFHVCTMEMRVWIGNLVAVESPPVRVSRWTPQNSRAECGKIVALEKTGFSAQ